MPCDLVVVGGGGVGCATALTVKTLRPDLDVVLLEAEDRLAGHQTGHNSGVVHSGLYYKPGSLKASLCVKGRESLVRFCDEEGIPFRRSGKLVVATREEELPRLKQLYERGKANGLMGLRWLSPGEAREREPALRCVSALEVPETGVVDFGVVTRHYAKRFEALGGEVVLGAKVQEIETRSDSLVLAWAKGRIRARSMVNCAGLESDRLARMCGLEPGVRIVPFRGEYFEVVEARRDLVKGLIYPVPDPRFPFLGVHFTKMVDGTLEVGPNAVLALSRRGYRRRDVSLRDLKEILDFKGVYRLASRYWRMGAMEMARSLFKPLAVAAMKQMVPEIEGRDLVRGKAGVRAQAMTREGALVDDFRFVEGKRSLHVLNAPSPAATASLAIAEVVAERILALEALAKRVG